MGNSVHEMYHILGLIYAHYHLFVDSSSGRELIDWESAGQRYCYTRSGGGAAASFTWD